MIESLQARCDAVHDGGAHIFGQLIHLGRESPGGLTDTVTLAPSAVPTSRDPAVAHEMTAAEVRTIVQGFGRSAANFQLAGYDGIEIHAAHGYLVAQFLSTPSRAGRGSWSRSSRRYARRAASTIRWASG